MLIFFSNLVAIYRKELQNYFSAPFAYVIAAVFWLIGGLFFVSILGQIVAQVAIQDQLGFANPVDVPQQFLRAYLGILASLSLFFLPMLSMSLYAEERKRGTLELLATSPVTNWIVALGKLLAVLTFFFTMTLPMLLYETIVFASSDPPVPLTAVFLGHVSLLLLAASVLSLGMFISSLTDSVILSAIMTFGLMMLLWVTDLIASNVQGAWGDALRHLSLLQHFENLSQGILETSGLVMFASYIFIGIFLTAQSIEAFRYQRS